MNQISNTAKPIKDTFAKKIICKFFTKIEKGYLLIEDPITTISYGEINSQLKTKLTIKSMQFYRTVLYKGSNGFAEAFISGDIETDNLTNLLRIFIQNREVIDNADGGFFNIFQYYLQMAKYLLLSSNTKKNAKHNIVSHYDLGNDFFANMLDSSMMYSSAYFPSLDTPLEEAAIAKIDLALESLKLQPCHNLLEIGSGWGSVAIHACKKYGCKVTTTTISEEQYNFIAKRIKQENLTDKITLLKKDYRDLDGKFDRLISIEMIEAVGFQYYDVFFQKCASLIKQNGLMLIQAILIRDNQFERAKREVDFIKKFIFPGSCIPSMGAIMSSIANTDLCLSHVNDLTLDYVLTLKHWFNKFNDNYQRILALGFKQNFVNCWNFYLSYCMAGFMENAIFDKQLIFTKPEYKQARYNEIHDRYF